MPEDQPDPLNVSPEEAKLVKGFFGDVSKNTNSAFGKAFQHENAFPDLGGSASAELPKYVCHKEVHAAKILEVIDPTQPGNETDGSRKLNVQGPYMPIRVDREYVQKHKPEAGGYYVVYADGYKSFSPAKAFEDGYTKV